MSESYLANLPRFDDRAYGDGLAHVASGEDAEPTDAETVETPEEAFERKLGMLEKTLTAATTLSDQLKQDAVERAHANLTAIAEQLFPHLTEAFLAEEIARHLPDILPQGQPTLELRAEPELAEALQALIDGSNRLAGTCTVITEESPGPNRASVSWGEGGIDFDFESLLEACMRRLKAA